MRYKEGYIALLTILITSSVAIVTALTLLSAGIGHLQTSISNHDYIQSKLIADSCTEVVLNRISDDHSYIGSDTMNLYNGYCNFAVTSESNDRRNIRIESIYNNNIYRQVLSVDILLSYIEIAEISRVANF